MVAVAILIFLIFLMSGSKGGLFAPKLVLRTYFDNAGGLKSGAPVTLEGVTIGNVMKIRVVPSHSPYPVEVTMRIAQEFARELHTDSITVIAQAGVLGEATSTSPRRALPVPRQPTVPSSNRSTPQASRRSSPPARKESRRSAFS
jgi:ABC-type transporter Mla subunit MlaD